MGPVVSVGPVAAEAGRVGSPDRFSLTGRTALVTGASRGIGAAIACAFAAAGADVVLCARSPHQLDRVVARIHDSGHRALPVPCDVTDPARVAACVDRTMTEMGSIDVLVNNAGGPLFHAPLLAVREQGWQRVLDLNLTSVLRFSQLAGTHMLATGRGSIINIASMLPSRSWPAIAAYSAAKAAVLNLTASLATAWGPHGVRANAICPGWVATDTNRSYTDHPAAAATAVDAVPLGRWAEPDDLVGTALWLASDASRYVTGAFIPVDGGLSVGASQAWQTQMAPSTASTAHNPTGKRKPR